MSKEYDEVIKKSLEFINRKKEPSMKKITKKEAEKLLFKVDMEGLSYAIMEGYLKAPGTELEVAVLKANAALHKVENILEALRDEYDLEYS